jgi:hypothetical protein
MSDVIERDKYADVVASDRGPEKAQLWKNLWFLKSTGESDIDDTVFPTEEDARKRGDEIFALIRQLIERYPPPVVIVISEFKGREVPADDISHYIPVPVGES